MEEESRTSPELKVADHEESPVVNPQSLPAVSPPLLTSPCMNYAAALGGIQSPPHEHCVSLPDENTSKTDSASVDNTQAHKTEYGTVIIICYICMSCTHMNQAKGTKTNTPESAMF